MSLEILMSRAHVLAIHPREYETLREHYCTENPYREQGVWWSFSFNGIQVVPDAQVPMGEILIRGVKNGELVELGKIVSVEE